MGQGPRDMGGIVLLGQVDAITDSCVWEIKCEQDLDLDGFLQLAFYAYIWCAMYPFAAPTKNFRLISAVSGEQWELELFGEGGCGLSAVESAVKHVVNRKLNGIAPPSDDEFLARARACWPPGARPTGTAACASPTAWCRC